MRKPWKGGGAIILLGVLAAAGAGCRSSGSLEAVSSRASRAQTDLLRQAGERLGVPIRPETIVQLHQAGGTLLTAPAVGLERIPATQLPQGVDVGVAYVDSRQGDVPRGVYALRAFANPQTTGPAEGRIELRNLSGEVVSRLPATFDIASLRVPSDATGFTVVQVRPQRLAGRCDSRYETCYCCPNGWIVCTGELAQFGLENAPFGPQ